MKTKRPEASSAIRLLDLVWDENQTAVAHSYERLNHAMRDALQLAIGAGFTFAAGDIKHIWESYRTSYWIGESPEWVYALAIAVGNLSAVKSFEAWKGRDAFIADDVRLNCSGEGYLHGGPGTRQKERLAVGFTFMWRGYDVKVTSFAGDGQSLTAVSHKERFHEGKVDKRFTITRDAIFAERAQGRERQKLLEQLNLAAGVNGNGKEITKALGIKTQADYATLPIDRIRKVAEKYPPPPVGPRVTKRHHKAAIEAGFCSDSTRRYPVGTPISHITADDWRLIDERAPELAADLRAAVADGKLATT